MQWWLQVCNESILVRTTVSHCYCGIESSSFPPPQGYTKKIRSKGIFFENIQEQFFENSLLGEIFDAVILERKDWHFQIFEVVE